MADEERLMSIYAEDPDDPGVLLPVFPAARHLSVWDRGFGLDCTLVPDYMEAMHAMHGEEVFGHHPLRANQFISLMCRELGVGDEDAQIMRFMNEMMSVRGAKALVLAQDVDAGVMGYAIICLYG